MNVLVLAYSCGPDRGSEPGVGWNWVGEIGSRHQTWVITTKEFKVEIEDKIRRESKNNLRFYFLDFPLRKIFWLFGGAGIRTHYMLWQVGALFKAVNLHRKTRFDLAHHLTFGINYLPTFLFLLPVPLIWGPLGGGEMIEPVLMRNFSWSGKLRERGKKVIQGVYPYIPINYIAMYKSALLLVRTVDTLKTIPYCFHDKTRVIPESGIAAMEIKGRKKVLSDAEGKRIISVGRLIEIKAFSIAIEAFGMMAGKYPHAQLIIIGEGRERKRLERAAISLGLSNRVFFTGKIQRAEVLKILESGDILLHPSLRDGAAWAILEAFSFGLPVICLNKSGPGLIVNEACGIRIEPRNMKQISEDMANAIDRLLSDPDFYKTLSEGCLRRIRGDLSWVNIGKRIETFYALVKTKNTLI